MIQRGLQKFYGKRVLFLQGPVGPFFWRLAKDFKSVGATVFKVNFNGGDFLFFPIGAINFRKRIEEWPIYFEHLLETLKIDVVLLFGDCRPIHRPACEIAKRRGIQVGVFEEGYLRPNHITFEHNGVNGNSQIPRNPFFYWNTYAAKNSQITSQVGNTFWFSVLWVCLYYFFAVLLKPVFRHYVHHRPLVLREALPWLRSGWRKIYYSMKERGVLSLLTTEFSTRYFLVPLQVHNDAQIHVHSGYDSVRRFIRVVIKSFACNAPRHTLLVIKHHPMDRAYFDYTDFIKRVAARYGVIERCFYVHDQHLPSLLKHARGVVVINSSVGLSALFHRVPVKVCGKAIYDMPGLTYQGTLDSFWKEAHKARPVNELYRRFADYLIMQTQLNGSFYKRLPNSPLKSGLIWPEHVSLIKKEGLSMQRAVKRIGSVVLACFLVAAIGIRDVHARNMTIHEKIDDQQHRINEGKRTGKLTPQEADIVQDNLNYVRNKMARMKSDGELSPQERKKLHHLLDENSELIYKKKHNFRKLY